MVWRDDWLIWSLQQCESQVHYPSSPFHSPLSSETNCLCCCCFCCQVNIKTSTASIQLLHAFTWFMVYKAHNGLTGIRPRTCLVNSLCTALGHNLLRLQDIWLNWHNGARAATDKLMMYWSPSCLIGQTIDKQNVGSSKCMHNFCFLCIKN